MSKTTMRLAFEEAYRKGGSNYRLLGLIGGALAGNAGVTRKGGRR